MLQIFKFAVYGGQFAVSKLAIRVLFIHSLPVPFMGGIYDVIKWLQHK
jgi:hypothetical protein